MPKADVIPFLKPSAGAVQTIGTVGAAEQDSFSVQTEYASVPARRALSCLLEPAIGDRVWLIGQHGEYFITAVLERSESTPLQLGVEGDVNLAVRNGQLHIAAARGITLATPRALDLAGGEFSLSARQGRILVDRMYCLGQRLMAEIDQIRLLGRWFDSVLERISKRVKRSYKIVEELDQVRSEQIDYRASKNFQLHGQNTLMSAKELVKVDAEQIHLG